jgi:hypothetical protein
MSGDRPNGQNGGKRVDAVDVWAKVYRRKPDVVTREVAGESLLVPIRGHLADMQTLFAVDAVAACIWSALDGARPLEAVLRNVLARFAVEEAVARADLRSFVGDLESAGLIECV